MRIKLLINYCALIGLQLQLFLAYFWYICAYKSPITLILVKMYYSSDSIKLESHGQKACAAYQVSFNNYALTSLLFVKSKNNCKNLHNKKPKFVARMTRALSAGFK